MKKEYDFSKGERGKFYRSDEMAARHLFVMPCWHSLLRNPEGASTWF